MEELIKRLERVIQTGAPDKDGQHPISAEVVLEVVRGLSELSTNLAEVGTNCSEFPNNSDAISRQQAIDYFVTNVGFHDEDGYPIEDTDELRKIWTEYFSGIPSAQPEKEKAKRVLWTGWKGCRDTRYKCPNCKKPVKNDDIYCHRCGQKLMFPHISFTDYVPERSKKR